MLAPQTTAATSWPIPGDAPDLLSIVNAQAATITDQEVLLHAYQGVLNAAQAPIAGTAATATGTAAASPNGNQLTVTTVTGIIKIGATVTDTGTTTTVPANTVIQGQISGTTGGAGVYLTSNATTASATPLTFTPPPTPETTWPAPTDAATLDLIVQSQTAVIRVQTALLQHYQDLLTISQTPAPPTGP